ncbi:MAG: YlxR family protein [Chloroflexi bacterium]|nr:YlxR family protein [Chloroflexota bacterium]
MVKHIPQRSCVACRTVRAKRELIRVVRTLSESVEIDQTGKKAGRGAYLCPDKACWTSALQKRSLEYALRISLDQATRLALEQAAERYG